MDKPTATIKMTQLDSFKRLLSILTELIEDERISFEIKKDYIAKTKELIDDMEKSQNK